MEELADVPLCERGERAMIKAAFETLAVKKKQSADWYQPHHHKLDPARDRMHSKMKIKMWMRQRKGEAKAGRGCAHEEGEGGGRSGIQ